MTMRYLYGDLTPFPHEVNYIELIRDTTELCAALLQIDEVIEGHQAQTVQENQSVQQTLAEFKQVAKDLAEALHPHITSATNQIVKEVSSRLVQSVRGVMENAQSTLVSRRDAALAGAESKIRAERARILPAMERLLLRHELANTTWTLRWSAGGEDPAEAQARASTPFGLQALFQLEIPPGSPWSRPVKVGDVEQSMAVHLPKKGRRGSTRRRYDLERYFLTELSREQLGALLVVRKALKPSSPGFAFRWQGNDLVVLPVDDPSFTGGPYPVDEADAAAALQMRETAESHLKPLVQGRVRLLAATHNGTDVARMNPAPLARLLLKAIAPYTREIVARSGLAGELTLKRVVEDGRREEVFITARELTELYARLSPERQAAFDELGLGEGPRREPSAPSVPPAPSVAPAPEPGLVVVGEDSSESIELADLLEAEEEEITKKSDIDDAMVLAMAKETDERG